MSFFKCLKNKKGFSLIELSVTMGVMGIVSMGVGSLILQQSKQNKSVRRVNAANEIAMEIASILKSPQMCESHLSGEPTGYNNGTGVFTPTEIDFTNGGRKPYLIAGGPSTFNGLAIDELRTVAFEKDINVDGDNNFNRTTIQVRFRVNAPDHIGGQINVRNFTLVHTGYNTFNTCLKSFSNDVDEARLCADMAGVWNGSKCMFCAGLGGYIDVPGTCNLSYIQTPNSQGLFAQLMQYKILRSEL